MASIRSRNTRPELLIRKRLYATGKRYHVHDRTVFGTPDISNRPRKLAVFIDGCFWHGCERCYRQPDTNTSFWKEKVIRNRLRRNTVKDKLTAENWNVLEFWEHEVLNFPDEVVGAIVKAWDLSENSRLISNDYL
jgi:DNA mismatch endonuclease (patch repair protein)